MFLPYEIGQHCSRTYPNNILQTRTFSLVEYLVLRQSPYRGRSIGTLLLTSWCHFCGTLSYYPRAHCKRPPSSVFLFLEIEDWLLYPGLIHSFRHCLYVCFVIFFKGVGGFSCVHCLYHQLFNIWSHYAVSFNKDQLMVFSNRQLF